MNFLRNRFSLISSNRFLTLAVLWHYRSQGLNGFLLLEPTSKLNCKNQLTCWKTCPLGREAWSLWKKQHQDDMMATMLQHWYESLCNIVKFSIMMMLTESWCYMTREP